MRQRRLFYGWYDPRENEYRMSRMPPDSPVRPSIAFTKKSEMMELAKNRRAEIFWYPDLPPNLPNDLSSMPSRSAS